MTTTGTHQEGSVRAPGPRLLERKAWADRLGIDVLSAMDDLFEQYGDVARLGLTPRGIYFVRGSEAARHVLVAHQDNYVKSHQYDLFRALLGEGLVTSSGDTWRRSRRMTQPLFAKRNLGVYAGHMAAAAEKALGSWQEQWDDGDQLMVDEEILHAGLDTVGRALVSHDFTGNGALLEEAIADSLVQIGVMSRRPLAMLGQDLPGLGIERAARMESRGAWRSYRASGRTVDDIVTELVEERVEHGHAGRDDLLHLLMDSEDPDTGERLSRQQVIDEVKTFIAAGHETTAHGLSWMYHLLGSDPRARARLHDELDTVLEGRVPTVEDTGRLPWLTACFQEAMRLYPPAWHIPRLAVEDDVIGGFHIPAGARVMVSVWSTHRDGSVYPEPLTFRPERWLGGAAAERPRFSYLPFGGGRRACVGQSFAMLNALVLGAMVSQRFELESVPGWRPRLQPSITLRPANGIPMTVHRRTH